MPLDTVPLEGVPGYRTLSTDQVSGGLGNPFIGLDAGGQARPKGDLADLHTAPRSAGDVPVASFSDYNCPYCRVLTGILADEAAAGGLSVTWHELPLLGPTSRAAARAALAAGMQGAYLRFHRHMMQSRFRPTRPYLIEAARTLGLDAERLLADMEGAEVTRQLERSAALADLFGIIGTPALVVGKTLVLGEISRRDLRRLVQREAG